MKNFTKLSAIFTLAAVMSAPSSASAEDNNVLNCTSDVIDASVEFNLPDSQFLRVDTDKPVLKIKNLNTDKDVFLHKNKNWKCTDSKGKNSPLFK